MCDFSYPEELQTGTSPGRPTRDLPCCITILIYLTLSALLTGMGICGLILIGMTSPFIVALCEFMVAWLDYPIRLMG